MASWNNTTSRPQWNGNGAANKSKYLVVSTIKADQIITQELYATTSVITPYVETASISSVNGSIAFLSNLVLNTNVIALGVSPTFLTAESGVLYVNGDAVAFPSSFSTIADWSQFKAVANVDMSRSSIYNVFSISTNTISTGTLNVGSVSTNNLASGNVAVNNISSGNIFFDTLNGRAGTITTLSGNDVVYSNAVLSNLTSLTHNTRQLNTSNIVASNDLRVPSISTILISSFLVEANTLYGHSTATGYLAANTISTNTIQAENVFNVQRLLLSDLVLVPEWQSGATYQTNNLTKYNNTYYIAKLANLNVNPSNAIPEWPGARNWLQYNFSWVDGLGSYRCLIAGYYEFTPNNYTGEGGGWEFIGPGNSASLVWLFSEQPLGANSGEIIGDSNSLVQVGYLSTMVLNTSSFNVADVTISNLSVRNITSSNIYNSNALQTNTLDVILDSQLNTLTTSGVVNTNDVLNVNGLLALCSDVYGQTQQITIPIPPFSVPEYLRSLYNIKNINCEAINVVGGATGNNFFPPYRFNSIVNIGETELSPGILNIYGVNAELTTALSVYGLTSLNGDTTINGLATVNGITDLNGDTTVLGFLDVGGTLDVAGITTITGATNIGGVLTVEGETNIAGLLTAEAGIVAVGALGFTGGDITIGGEPASSPTNNFNFYNYYRNTNVEALTVNRNGDFRQDVGVAGNLNVGGIIFGTVVSGSESISTLNVSTLRAHNISSITNTTEEFFVSSIAGYSNRTIHFNNDIVVPSISTTALNMITGTGNVLSLKSYESQPPTLDFNRKIDGVDFVDGVIGSAEDVGFIVAGFSTINISALNDITITSAENVNLVAENSISVSTNVFGVTCAAAISSIYTNYISTPLVESRLVDLYSQNIEENPIAGVIFSRNIDGEKVGDSSIAIDNVNGFQIASASTIRMTANDDMLITSQGNTILFNENSNIILSAPETIIPFNLNVSSISTGYVIAGTVIATNGIGTTNVTTSNLFSDYTSTGSIYANSIIVNSISTNSLFVNNYSGDSISTNRISTGSLLAGSVFTNSYNGSNAGANLNMNGSIIPTSVVPKDLGASGAFRWRNLWVSTISSIHIQTSTIVTRQIATDRIIPVLDSGTNTANLYPASAGAQIGFFGSSGTNSGGFYNQVNARSTNTQVLTPDVVGAFSNNIRVQGNLSTQNVFVSSINNKLYPYTSTLNIPFSSFSITGNQAGTPILLYSNVDFRTQGFHRISQKTILSKNTGGASADIHANIFYTVGAFPSTPSITDGYSALPMVNQDNASTFTTLFTELYVSTPTTRNILYYDATANNYTARLYMGSLFDSVTPDFGNNSTRIPSIL
jgi:hypothetical protein